MTVSGLRSARRSRVRRRQPGPRILLHVGLPKTGTTSLQELVFSAHPRICYFGQTNLWREPDAKTVLKALLLGDEADLAAASKILANAAQGDRAIVISDEALTLGEFMLRATRWPLHSDHTTTANRARALLGHAQILIVLRAQADWIESWHLQGLKSGKYVETNYHAWLKHDLGGSAERLLALLEYDALYEAYCSAFGAQHVHVRFYEHYKNRFHDLAAESAGLVGVDADRARQLIIEGEAHNVSGSQYAGLAPIVKRLAAHEPMRGFLDALPVRVREALRNRLVRDRTYLRLNEADRAAIGARFAAGNVRLQHALRLKDLPDSY
jgi:hypothetical protein